MILNAVGKFAKPLSILKVTSLFAELKYQPNNTIKTENTLSLKKDFTK